MSDFLDKLKKAADEGEFNSEAAKKILEINELADKKIGGGTPEDLEKLQKSLDKRVEGSEEKKSVEEKPEQSKEEKAVEEKVETVSKEKVEEAYTEYEKKMARFKKMDAINAQLATLTEIEEMVELSIADMFSFVAELETKFQKEFETEDPMFGELYLKIESIKSKYKS